MRNPLTSFTRVMLCCALLQGALGYDGQSSEDSFLSMESLDMTPSYKAFLATSHAQLKSVRATEMEDEVARRVSEDARHVPDIHGDFGDLEDEDKNTLQRNERKEKMAAEMLREEARNEAMNLRFLRP